MAKSKSTISLFEDGVGEKLTFHFKNPKAALYFKHWLCGSGEQGYWEWMEYREQEESGDITGLDFDYHTGDSTIPVKTGRTDSDK